MLVRLLYCSQAVDAKRESMLDDILAQSRRHNPASGVTGMLCVSGEDFIQLLEGGRDEVCELYNAIVRDDRHKHVRLLSFEEISERKFNAWSMGQVDLAKVNPGLLLKYFTRAKLAPAHSPGRATLALLDELAASGAIVTRTET